MGRARPDLMDTRGRVSKDERKRVERIAREHSPKSSKPDAEPGFIPQRVSFRKAVVIASSVSVCMFCSRPNATMQFSGDDTVRICEACLDG